jgi:murein DD-endopeptidase MepM/ murein hydrolase activator NlpD
MTHRAGPVGRSRARRPIVAALVALLLISAGSGAAAAPCLRPPVDAPVVDPFRAPACPWCPGNRGLEFAVAPGTVVRVAAAGTVTFAGAVAGVRYVVIEQADGLRATYGSLASSHLRAGQRVPAGAIVGTSGASFHFGLRRGVTYVDPEPYLGRWVTRPRLVPTDATPARPAPPPNLRCPAGGAGQRPR